jgi:hypothetical protein
MFVKPNAGRAVRDPVKGILLPISGAEVPDNTFWRRRLRDADVSLSAAATPAAVPNTVKTTQTTATDTAAEDTK